MFISTLMTIPWIIFGFKNPSKKFLALNQTPKSLLTLLIIEIVFFLVLVLLLDKPNPDVAGQGDFDWTYLFVYDKGIFPIIGLTEIDDHLFNNLGNYKISFFISALIVDYILLYLISPRLTNIFKSKKYLQQQKETT